MTMIEIILESFNSLFKSIDMMLKTKDLTLGAILAGLAPFIAVWVKLSREKEKRARAKLVERRQLQIAFNVNEIMEALKVESKWSLQEIGSTNAVQKSYKQLLTMSCKATLQKKFNCPRRKNKMKAYLKKLGKTKFQALLFSLIVNIVSAALFMTGTLDIDSVLNVWIPIINMTIGTISTWVYIIVEGSIDKASLSATGQVYTTGGPVDAKPTIDIGDNR